MTVRAAREKIQTLRDVVMFDGRVDAAEAALIEDFIDPYVKSGDRRFASLKKVLSAARRDGRIDGSEQAAILAEMDEIVRFLRVEETVERILTWVFVAGVASAAVYAFVG